jgi:hypothetical protein
MMVELLANILILLGAAGVGAVVMFLWLRTMT